MVKNGCSHSAHKHKIHFHMHNSNKYTKKKNKNKKHIIKAAKFKAARHSRIISREFVAKSHKTLLNLLISQYYYHSMYMCMSV